MSYSIIQQIKLYFNNYYTNLARSNSMYEEGVVNLKNSIKEGCFTNIYKFDKKKLLKCITNKINRIKYTNLFKIFGSSFLSVKERRMFFEKLIHDNFILTVYRAVRDNRQIEYMPSKLILEKEVYYEFPFSTTLDYKFAKEWLQEDNCCIYVININFSQFYSFIDSDGDLEYLPFMYLDNDQSEVTLGPGYLTYKKEFDIKTSTKKKTKFIIVDYLPVAINRDWQLNLNIECS